MNPYEWVRDDAIDAIKMLSDLNATISTINVLRILKNKDNRAVSLDCWSTYIAIYLTIEKEIDDYFDKLKREMEEK